MSVGLSSINKSVNDEINPYNLILFRELVAKLERFRIERDKLAKGSNFGSKAASFLLKAYIDNSPDHSIYPLLRLLVPDKDTKRSTYNLQENKVSLIYRRILNLESSGDLKAEKGSLHSDLRRVLDARVGEERIKSREGKDEYTLEDINNLLDELTGGDNASKEQLFERIYAHFSAAEQCWLTRIVLKKMELRITSELFNLVSPEFSTMYKMNTNLYEVCAQIASKKYLHLKGVKPLNTLQPMLAGKPLDIPASFIDRDDPNTALEICKYMEGSCIMDVKVDGDRMILHKKGDTIKLVTRNGNDYTQKCMSLCYRLKEELNKLDVDIAVLDGECLSWDNTNKIVLPFGQNPTVRKYEEEIGRNRSEMDMTKPQGDRWLYFVLFDVIYAAGDKVNAQLNSIIPNWKEILNEKARDRHNILNDQGLSPDAAGDISDLPLWARRKLLKSMIGDGTNKILECIESTELLVVHNDSGKGCEESSNDLIGDAISIGNQTAMSSSSFATSSMPTKDEYRAMGVTMERFFLHALEQGHEGLVIKRRDAPYLFGDSSRDKRVNRKIAWIKLKPDLVPGMIEDLDLAVLGSYWGSGTSTRGQGISQFLVGVKSDKKEKGKHLYIPIVRIGTGYNFEELKELRTYFEDRSIKSTDKKILDENGYANSKKYNTEDTYIPPWIVGDAEGKRRWYPNKENTPVFWYRPEASICFQILTGEIMASPKDSNWPIATLRFPRVDKIRWDKEGGECMTLEDLKSTKEKPRIIRAATSNANDTCESDIQQRRRKRNSAGTGNTTNTSGIPRDMRVASPFAIPLKKKLKNEIPPECRQLLKGFKVCVLPGNYKCVPSVTVIEDAKKPNTKNQPKRKYSRGTYIKPSQPKEVTLEGKDALNQLLLHHGAHLLGYTSTCSLTYLVGDPSTSTKPNDTDDSACTITVFSYPHITKQHINQPTLHVSWVLDSLKTGRQLDRTPKYEVGKPSDNSRDVYGDGYEEEVNDEDLDRLFRLVEAGTRSEIDLFVNADRISQLSSASSSSTAADNINSVIQFDSDNDDSNYGSDCEKEQGLQREVHGRSIEEEGKGKEPQRENAKLAIGSDNGVGDGGEDGDKSQNEVIHGVDTNLHMADVERNEGPDYSCSCIFGCKCSKLLGLQLAESYYQRTLKQKNGSTTIMSSSSDIFDDDDDDLVSCLRIQNEPLWNPGYRIAFNLPFSDSKEDLDAVREAERNTDTDTTVAVNDAHSLTRLKMVTLTSCKCLVASIGAFVAESKTEVGRATHIIVHKADDKLLPSLQKAITQTTDKPVVLMDWILECYKSGEWLELEDKYLVKHN